MGFLLKRGGDRGRISKDHIGLQGDQLFRERLRLSAGGRKATIDANIAVRRPSEPFERFAKRRKALADFRVVFGVNHEQTDASHSLGLLRSRRERPSDRCTADKRDELAPFHSITSSARRRNDEGTLRPSAFAVLRLRVNWTLTGSWTGSSLGFVPRKMRSA